MAVYTGGTMPTGEDAQQIEQNMIDNELGIRRCILRGCDKGWRLSSSTMKKKYCGDKHRAEAHLIKIIDKERERILWLLDHIAPAWPTYQQVTVLIKERLGLGAGE